jgi:hypothetical protein
MLGQTVHRIDVGNKIRADHRTVQGHARIPAALSRTGVQNYPQADGTTRREYRSPEEVFKAESLHSFDTATVTVGHPGMVTPESWKEHAVGEVRSAKRDGRYVAAELVIRDQRTLDQIADGSLVELSCGYDCTLVMGGGVSPEGETYDAQQTDITINHVGLGPSNWGRAGSEVRLRLDSGEVAYLDADEARTRPTGMTPEQIAALQKDLADTKLRADSLEAKLRAAAPATPAPIAAPAPALQAPHNDAGFDRIVAQRDEAIAKAAKLEQLSSASHLDGLVTERIAVLDGARLLHGTSDIPITGTVRTIQVAAIVARDPAFKADGRSDDYIASRFDAKVEDLKKAGASLGALNAASVPAHADATVQNSDAELSSLMKRFDQALDFSELYAAAEPWRNGELSARGAAITAMKGT